MSSTHEENQGTQGVQGVQGIQGVQGLQGSPGEAGDPMVAAVSMTNALTTMTIELGRVNARYKRDRWWRRGFVIILILFGFLGFEQHQESNHIQDQNRAAVAQQCNNRNGTYSDIRKLVSFFQPGAARNPNIQKLIDFTNSNFADRDCSKATNAK